MGFLSKINPFHKEWREPTQEEYNQFMQGFRYGCPLEGEVQPEQTHAGTKQYRRGLKAGKKAYIPGIPFEDPEAVYDGEDK